MDSEVELARKVVAYLRDQQWEVYQEVKPMRTCVGVADIVATQGNLIWIVECKLSFGLAVVEQAVNWYGWAHYVSVAVPWHKKSNRILQEYIKWKGIGLIGPSEYDGSLGPGIIAPKINRRAIHADKLRKSLTEKHKTFAEAGNNNGRYYSPFQHTCDNIRKHLKSNPGCSFKELVASIQTHYHSAANARSSIYHWALNGGIKGVEARKEGRFIRMYLTEEREDHERI